MSLDVERIRSILGEQFPSLAAGPIAWLGEGYDSVAFEVDATWVFRFPKREDVEQQLLRELRVLPAIAAQSPVAIPEYRFAGSPSALFPRLRRIPEVAGGTGAPVDARFQPARFGRRSGRSFSRPYFEQTPPSGSTSDPAVVVHGDLAAEHVLVDPESGTVTGVIDWSEIALSSAAADLAALFHWGGGSFAANALQHYEHPVTAELLQQARFIAACRAVLDVTFGLGTGRPEYIAGALRTLKVR